MVHAALQKMSLSHMKSRHTPPLHTTSTTGTKLAGNLSSGLSCKQKGTSTTAVVKDSSKMPICYGQLCPPAVVIKMARNAHLLWSAVPTSYGQTLVKDAQLLWSNTN
jgi:hypothetical protein